ncbi:hypothetical protein SDC9_05966 [bioreactor metagenome]|uniref:Uncharacterized protein n=1 Tax=bioreactor metagenome TaxID=1076179 RepID=A0A644T0H9_9ZZZZ|nr:hypothetical protein [Negativicutes bacterium]
MNQRILIWGMMGIIAISFILGGCGNSDDKKAVQQTTKQSNEVKKQQAEATKELPKINFTGQINPTVAQKGSKVVIRIDVENLDKEKTIDNVRLLFSDSDFLEQGLIIVNVMSGGQQDGRAFVWQNEGMKMKPGEKRSFQIVAQANKPGKYQSIIQIKDAKSSKEYKDPSNNSELVAKLTVLN